MKILTILLLFCVSVVSAQNSSRYLLGTNGTNTPEVLTPEVIDYVVDLAVDTFAFTFRDDKYLGAVAPAEEVANVIALNNALRQEGKVLAMCFTVYTKSGYSVANAMSTMDQFLDAGILIYSVRFGNEEWAKAAGGGKARTFAEYWSYCEPYLEPLQQRGVDRVLIPVTRPGDVPDWNIAAAAKLNSSWLYQPDYHPYWGPNQAPVMDTLDDKTTSTVKEEDLPKVNAGTYQPFHDWFYLTLYEQVRAFPLFEDINAWHNANIPGKEWHITEIGPPTGVGHVGNAIGFEASLDWALNELERYPVRFVTVFNGPSPTGTAIISPVNSKYEVSSAGEAYKKRLKYWTIREYLIHRDVLTTSVIEKPGVYVFPIHNMTEQSQQISISVGADVVIDTAWWEGLSGTYYYSSSGMAPWWGSGSPKTYEVLPATAGNVPARSFGYVTVSARYAITGCTDASALNYNPDAESDDSSCFYLSDCGCWDVTATNYDATTPCQDNTKCEYAATECWKKRWLFKGCKLDPKCKVNNCSPK